MKLLKAEREALKKTVKDTVFDDEIKKKYEAFVDKERAKLLDYVDEYFPKSDMEVLRKYKHARDYYEITIQGNYSCGFPPFVFRLSKPVCVESSYIRNDAWAERLNKEKSSAEKAHDNIRKHYYTIIESSSTWEKLIQVWPEAKAFMPVKSNPSAAIVPVTAVRVVSTDSKKRKWG